jgi:hypothetical protein
VLESAEETFAFIAGSDLTFVISGGAHAIAAVEITTAPTNNLRCERANMQPYSAFPVPRVSDSARA